MTQQRRRAGFVVGFLVLTAGLVAGCGGGGSDSSDDGDTTKVAAVLFSRDVPLYQAIGDGIQDQADTYGWEVNINYTKPDPATEADAINTAAVQQPDGIIVVPIDPVTVATATKSALDKSIPVIAVADDLEDSEARTAYVGSDFTEIGERKAQWIVDQLDGSGNVGVIHGIRGIHFTEGQFEGAQNVFSENPGINVVDGPYAGTFTAEAGLTATQNLLTANPDLDAIYFDNDDLALGGAQALRERGLSDKVLVVSTDGLAAGLEGLRKGEIDFTLAQCPADMARQAVQVLKQELDNEGSVPSTVTTPVFPITPDTLDQFEKEHKDCLS